MFKLKLLLRLSLFNVYVLYLRIKLILFIYKLSNLLIILSLDTTTIKLNFSSRNPQNGLFPQKPKLIFVRLLLFIHLMVLPK